MFDGAGSRLRVVSEYFGACHVPAEIAHCLQTNPPASTHTEGHECKLPRYHHNIALRLLTRTVGGSGISSVPVLLLLLAKIWLLFFSLLLVRHVGDGSSSDTGDDVSEVAEGESDGAGGCESRGRVFIEDLRGSENMLFECLDVVIRDLRTDCCSFYQSPVQMV